MADKKRWYVGQFKNGTLNTGGKREDYTEEDCRLAAAVLAEDRDDAQDKLRKIVSSVKRKLKANAGYNACTDESFIKKDYQVFLFVPADF